MPRFQDRQETGPHSCANATTTLLEKLVAFGVGWKTLGAAKQQHLWTSCSGQLSAACREPANNVPGSPNQAAEFALRDGAHDPLHDSSEGLGNMLLRALPPPPSDSPCRKLLTRRVPVSVGQYRGLGRVAPATSRRGPDVPADR